MEKSKSNERVHIIHDGVDNQQNSLPKASTPPPPQPKINERSIPESSKMPPPPKKGK